MGEEGRGAGGKGQGGIAPVAQRLRRRRADQQIANDAAAQRGRKRQHHDAEEIEIAADRRQRPFDGKDQRAAEIGKEDQPVNAPPHRAPAFPAAGYGLAAAPGSAAKGAGSRGVRQPSPAPS